MSKRRDIERRLRTLGEVKDIMGAMKNLSLMEIRELTRFLGTQRKVVASMETAAADFLKFFPEFIASPAPATPVYILIGSERGFCGDFNETLLREWQRIRQEPSVREPLLVTVGYRLSAKSAPGPCVMAHLNGPTTAAEVGSVLSRLMETLSQWKSGPYPLSLTTVYHTEEGVTVRAILPLPRFEQAQGRFSFPPVLNLSPGRFFVDLVEHYLYASLHELLYTSLMTENRMRLQHMESAIRHIEKEAMALERKRNILRQEEITEDIEVILLSAEEIRRRR